MKWWNDLWLNESFASWMGDKAINDIFPEWDVWTNFVVDDTNIALELDGLANSHPIEQEVNNPAEIGQLFDAISYSKGASILRMLEAFLSPNIFQKGISLYMKSHEYSNAKTTDLWNALEIISKKPVQTIMKDWTSQTGYPLINIKIESAGPSKIELSINQTPFRYDAIMKNNSTLEKQIDWNIPLTIDSYNASKITAQLIVGIPLKRAICVEFFLFIFNDPIWMTAPLIITFLFIMCAKVFFATAPAATRIAVSRAEDLPPPL